MMPFAVMRLKASGGGGGGTLGIDSYATGVTGLHALKRKWTGYAGSCIRIRRSSDNTEQDIGFVSGAIDAAVDSSAAQTFCGAGDGFVTKIYDQSGNGNNWAQATNAKQARCVASGVWDGFVRFDGSDDTMQSVNNSGTVAVYNLCLMAVPRNVASGSAKVMVARGTIGASGQNACAWAFDTAAGFGWNLQNYLSQGTNYFRNGYSTTKGPTVSSSRWMAWDYTQTTVANQAKLYQGSTVQTIDTNFTSGTISTSTIGTVQKWDLASGAGTSGWCDLNWFADILIEGSVSDANKAAMQTILER
ncbi:arabinofuranosidase catalytic domain-containing protein [Variovorax sp. GT1P44]|uniref:arabinofuranosidase catalytic domain-containing protein n=1 Tax=Variovorax sp. GT1P44 TaxID=3443742 RepID=UPI003F447C89